jgi:hypothetical protein
MAALCSTINDVIVKKCVHGQICLESIWVVPTIPELSLDGDFLRPYQAGMRPALDLGFVSPFLDVQALCLVWSFHRYDSQVAAQLLVGRAFSNMDDVAKWAKRGNSVPSLGDEAYAMAYHFLTLASQNLMPPLAIVDMLATFFRALGDC